MKWPLSQHHLCAGAKQLQPGHTVWISSVSAERYERAQIISTFAKYLIQGKGRDVSELKKMQVVIKNSVHNVSDATASSYDRVRVEDERGQTHYFKSLIVPAYVKKKGAVNEGTPRVWYVKEIKNGVSVIVAYESPAGALEYDFDEIKVIARSSVVMGLKFAVLTVPAGVIVGVATYGLGLLLMPWIAYASYRHLFKVPAMLNQKTLIEDFSKLGVAIQPH